MDFFSWLGSEISDGVDWIFKDVKGKDILNLGVDAAKAFGGSTKQTGSNAMQSIMRAPQDQIRSGPGFHTTPTKPAEVHTLDKTLFKGENQDPWMYTFRSVVNKQQQQIAK